MKVAILTGASSGIGYAVASQLAKKEYTLIIGSRRPEKSVKKLQDLGANVIGVAGDLADVQMSKRLIVEAEKLGKLPEPWRSTY